MSGIEILTWDYRQQPDIDELDRIVYNLSCCGQPVRIQPVETGCDAYAVAISSSEQTETAIQDAWLAHSAKEGW